MILEVKDSDFYFGKCKTHEIITTNKIGQTVSLSLTKNEFKKFKSIAELLGLNECELLHLIYERGVTTKWGMVEREKRSYEIYSRV